MPVTVQFPSLGGIGASSGFSPCPTWREAALARRSSGVSGGGATNCAFSEVVSLRLRLRTRCARSSVASHAPIEGRAVSGLPVA